ncbi:MAG: hypothetical protein ACXW2P_04725, partial [Thermoanaerobaculia bacterium]
MPTSESRVRGLTLTVQALGALLIAAAARGDLWFDEIWSLERVRGAGTMLAVLRTRHDNNHVLNSLYLHLVGDGAPLYIYRLFAVVCGIASLCVIAHIARRWGHAEALYSVILVSTSFPLLLYFSEARGYAPAMLFGLVAYLLTVGERTTRARIALFWAVSMLGLLAHLTFVIVSAALLVIRRERYLVWHSVPLLFTAIWYVTFVRHLMFGAGPVYAYGDVAAHAASLLIGLPERWASAAVILLVVAIVAVGAGTLRRDHDPSWAFYVAVILIAPLAVVLMTTPRYLYVRYFVVTFPFFYLLLARLLGRYGRPSRARWAIAACFVLVFTTAQSGRIWMLLDVGRGQYSLALAGMSAASGGRPLLIGRDNDVNTVSLLRFYVPR